VADVAVVVSVVRDGTVALYVTTTALPAPLDPGALVWAVDLGAFDDAARCVVEGFLDRWFTVEDLLRHVQVLPVHGAGRAARRRGDA
jgi:hypothetical protein